MLVVVGTTPAMDAKEDMAVVVDAGVGATTCDTTLVSMDHSEVFDFSVDAVVVVDEVFDDDDAVSVDASAVVVSFGSRLVVAAVVVAPIISLSFAASLAVVRVIMGGSVAQGYS